MIKCSSNQCICGAPAFASSSAEFTVNHHPHHPHQQQHHHSLHLLSSAWPSASTSSDCSPPHWPGHCSSRRRLYFSYFRKCHLVLTVSPFQAFHTVFCHCTSSSSCRRLHEEFHYSITVVQAIITFFVISNFFCTTFFDPGIIKRGMFAVFIILHALYYTKPSSFATESPVSLQRFLMRMWTTLGLRCSKKL